MSRKPLGNFFYSFCAYKRVKNGYPETQFIEDLAERDQGNFLSVFTWTNFQNDGGGSTETDTGLIDPTSSTFLDLVKFGCIIIAVCVLVAAVYQVVSKKFKTAKVVPYSTFNSIDFFGLKTAGSVDNLPSCS